MKISLVMPTINVTTELDLFLKSLKAQTYKDFELIVVDQNEGNEVFEIVKDYEEEFKIKYVRSDERGLSLNRNRGLILMKGEIVGFPDDDCEYQPDTIEKVVSFFEKKKEFFSKVKSNINENYDKKLALVEKAEALKDSIDWGKTSEILIECQKEWKEIGPVARKKTEELWKRFHNAVDEFFKARESASKHNSPHREGKNKHIVSEKSLLMQKYNKLQQEITN